MVALSLVGVPGLDILLHLILLQSEYALAHRGGGAESEEGETLTEGFQLGFYLFFGDAFLLQLNLVFCC